MEKDRESDSLFGPGRPAAGNGRNVAEDIIKAVKVCLETKNPQEISTREIALVAGTRPTMVNYYFGSRDGVFVEIVHRSMKAMKQRFLQIKEDIAREVPNNPTRLLVEEYARIYNADPAFCKILLSEIFREESSVRNYLLEKRPTYARTMLAELITLLSVSGYYRKNIDIDGVCSLIQSVVLFPLIVRPFTSSKSDGCDSLLDEAWMELVSSVFDGYLASPKKTFKELDDYQ